MNTFFFYVELCLINMFLLICKILLLMLVKHSRPTECMLINNKIVMSCLLTTLCDSGVCSLSGVAKQPPLQTPQLIRKTTFMKFNTYLSILCKSLTQYYIVFLLLMLFLNVESDLNLIVFKQLPFNLFDVFNPNMVIKCI
jgi:hypothetical protein